MKNLNLLPQPRSLAPADGTYTLKPGRRIVLQSASPSTLLFSAQRLQTALREHARVDWELSAADTGTASETPALHRTHTSPRSEAEWECGASVGTVLRVSSEQVPHPQGYELAITPDRITVTAHDDAGIFYGVGTLIQIILQFANRRIPCLHISDHPDFPVRGVMLDISRDKVPTLNTLLSLVDMLAGWKINQLQLYTEHTFAYRNHPEVWAKASPITGQDVLELDRFCSERFIELVPNQNSFGHMHHWLIHPRYAPLAEVEGDFNAPWGRHEGPFSLCPLDPGSLELVRSLYDELLPHFSSRMFNVGCDETFDVGQGRSKAECEKRGTGRVYLDYLLKIYREVKARDHTMQFWGDIIVQQPSLIPELPKDIIALEWGYEADHPFDEHGAQFAAAGTPFYVCPGTSSWCSLAGRTDNAVGNLLNAAENGLKHGATGYLNTDWGDNGHWQFLPISYLGFAVGAAYSWALDANRDLDVPRAVSLHAFRDPTGTMGRVAYDLGNVYKAVGIEPHNSSVLFWVLQWPLEQIRADLNITPAAFKRTLKAVGHAMRGLEKSKMNRPDAGLIVQEYENTARLMRHACRRALLALESNPTKAARLRRELDQDMRQIIRDYKRLWLARNRPGGLIDSVARFERARKDYRNT